MSDQAKSRFSVDLDDLERQLRTQASSQPKAASNDPLAELARLVGQDDPFKAMFNDRKVVPMPPAHAASVPAPPVQVAAPGPQPLRRTEPSLDSLLRDLEARVPASSQPARPVQDERAAFGQPASPEPSVSAAPGSAAPRPVQAPSPDMLEEFDRLLQGELRGAVAPAGAARPEPAVREQPQPALHDDGFDDLDAELRPSVQPQRAEAQGAAVGAARDLDADRELERLDDHDWRGQQNGGAADYPEPPVDEVEDMRSLEPRQPRKGLVIAGALLGVAALGIGVVVGIGGFSGAQRPAGEPPVIRAEAGPTKVQPLNPGGVEIPNQNKEIYERSPEPKAGQTRVVTREEQPMDVQATARAAARVILPGPGTPEAVAPAEPAAPALAAAPVPAEAPPAVAQPPAPALGEPRRVRTVAVRPDGTIAPANGAAAAPVAVAAAPAEPRAPAAAPPPRPVPPVAAERPAPPPRAAAPAPAAPAPAAPVPAAPARTASLPPAAPAGSGFMVQLAAPGSESEARATFSSLQRRFGDQLAGDSPVVRRAELNGGRTVYRLRVGPYSREGAVQKCEALKAAGGQCFVAPN